MCQEISKHPFLQASLSSQEKIKKKKEKGKKARNHPIHCDSNAKCCAHNKRTRGVWLSVS